MEHIQSYVPRVELWAINLNVFTCLTIDLAAYRSVSMYFTVKVSLEFLEFMCL